MLYDWLHHKPYAFDYGLIRSRCNWKLPTDCSRVSKTSSGWAVMALAVLATASSESARPRALGGDQTFRRGRATIRSRDQCIGPRQTGTCREVSQAPTATQTFRPS